MRFNDGREAIGPVVAAMCRRRSSCTAGPLAFSTARPCDPEEFHGGVEFLVPLVVELVNTLDGAALFVSLSRSHAKAIKTRPSSKSGDPAVAKPTTPRHFSTASTHCRPGTNARYDRQHNHSWRRHHITIVITARNAGRRLRECLDMLAEVFAWPSLRDRSDPAPTTTSLAT